MLFSYLFKLIVIVLFFCACGSDSNEESTPVIENPVTENPVTENPVTDNPETEIVISISEVTNLANEVDETSGLINFNNLLITHNDSGDQPNLYEINPTNGNVVRTIVVLNAKNTDMEDIAQDENYIYLCDIGNNSNVRKDQTIYKIKKTDYLAQDEVNAEIITIAYKEQTDFSSSNYTTNFDAEAVIATSDHLFLFTKNWGDSKTDVYAIPKIAGDYEISKLANADVKGLITGADFDENKNRIILTGYSNFQPFVVILSNFSKENPLDGKIERKSLKVNGSSQIEGISINPDGSYYLSAEKSLGYPAILYKMILN